MILLSVLLAMSASTPAIPVASGMTAIAEGPSAQIAAAREALARCRFSRIEIVPGSAGRAELRVPARELGPHQATCVNMVSDATRLPGVRWSAPDLRQH